ncbi:MFS transporter [Proteus hauseri]|uniref:MFS transporter n=1 Tax=Proteus hauseri TaxID=183417 RepID=UPI0032DB6FBA
MNSDNSLKKYLIAAALPIVLSSLSTSIANIALPTISEAFNASFSMTRWVIISYLISLTGASILTGSISDRFDHKPFLIGSIILFTIASIACSLAPSINGLIICRIIQGIAAAAMMNTTMSLLASVKSSNGAGLTMGWIGTLSAIGTAGGPTVGGVLLDIAGWQSIFYLNIPLSIISLVLIYKLIDKQPITTVHKQIDFTGISVLTLSIILYSLGMTSWSSDSIWYIALAAIGTILFIIIEMRVKSPAISIELMRHPSLYIGASMSLIVATVIMSTLIIGPFYLIHKLSLSPWMVGLIMAFGPVIAACLGLPAGKLVDRFGSNNIIIIALTIMFSGFILFALNGNSLSAISYMLFMTVVTIGYAVFQTANNTGLMFGVNLKQKGILSGILSLSRNIGLINGATLMGTIFSIFSGGSLDGDLNLDNISSGFSAVYYTASGLVLVALGLSLWLKGKSSWSSWKTTGGGE